MFGFLFWMNLTLVSLHAHFSPPSTTGLELFFRSIERLGEYLLLRVPLTLPTPVTSNVLLQYLYFCQDKAVLRVALLL